MDTRSSNISQPANVKVLQYLSKLRPPAPVFALWNSVPDPYTRCGCHPDIVGVLWDSVNSKLPADCRALVYGNPALVHPRGVIFAIGMGTWHGYRLPGILGTEAVKDGVKTTEKFGDSIVDIQARLGEDWYYGFLPSPGYRCADDAWCQLVYEMLDQEEGND